MTITFTAQEIAKFAEAAKIFGAPTDDIDKITEKFEEAVKKPEELQYSWGHVAVTPNGIEMHVLPSTMCKTAGALTALAPTIHKFIGIGQMLKPVFIEFAGKLNDVSDKITSIFKTPCINGVYDFDLNGKRVTVATCRNDVPNGTLLIKAVINDGDGLVDDKTIRREIENRKPVFVDPEYSKDNELHGCAYDRALHLVRRHNRDELEAIIAENGWKTVKDIAESFKAYDIYAEDEKTAHRI